MNSKLHSPPSTCPEAEDLAGEMTCIVGMISESPGMCAKDKTYTHLISKYACLYNLAMFSQDVIVLM